MLRGELWSLGGMFTPPFTHKGEHYLLFRKTEGQKEGLQSRGYLYPCLSHFCPQGLNRPQPAAGVRCPLGQVWSGTIILWFSAIKAVGQRIFRSKIFRFDEFSLMNFWVDEYSVRRIFSSANIQFDEFLGWTILVLRVYASTRSCSAGSELSYRLVAAPSTTSCRRPRWAPSSSRCRPCSTETGWPDWENFCLFGDCLLWVLFWKLQK
jgi:hypothetical protein